MAKLAMTLLFFLKFVGFLVFEKPNLAFKKRALTFSKSMHCYTRGFAFWFFKNMLVNFVKKWLINF